MRARILSLAPYTPDETVREVEWNTAEIERVHPVNMMEDGGKLMGGTSIEWTDETWNPVTGCTKVSPGCDHCYAEAFTKRFNRRPFEEITLHPERLGQPLAWKKPRRIFTCSMSDLFHDKVPWDYLLKVFEAMAATYDHTFQVLTKRPGRMDYFANTVLAEYQNCHPMGPWNWLPNVWAGTSVESAKYLPRLDVLARVPAKVRFVSCEPLLGPLDLRPWLGGCPRAYETATGTFDPSGGPYRNLCAGCGAHKLDHKQTLSWVIVGGESGPGARPMHPQWVRDIKDQCQEAGVPFFFKQWGEWRHLSNEVAQHIGRSTYVALDGGTYPAGRAPPFPRFDGYEMLERVGKKAAGAMLDGREWREMP